MAWIRWQPNKGTRVRLQNRQPAIDEIRELLSRKRTNVWVPWVQIREAALRQGFTASRLRMSLTDGRSVKFLWLPDRRTFETLRDRLLALVGPNLRIG